MKFLIILLSAVMTFSSYALDVDLKKSEFKWKGTKVTGKHVGTIGLKSAKLKDSKGVLSSGVLEIDLSTISVSDLQGEWKQKLEGHLKSKDFFNVGKFPTAKLDITSLKNGKLIGALTIKGKKNPVSTAFVKKDKTYSGKLKFDRTKFDMPYKSGNFFKDLGDKMIHNEVEIDFKVVLK
jgi:polyisoprenoid-binding protein YceI